MKHISFITAILFASFSSTSGQNVTLSDTLFKTGDRLEVKPVFFDFNKSTILQESFPYLDSVAAFLVKNENLVIEVANHTDTRWTDKYSTCLSCNRAKAVRNYLIAKGISQDRLVSKGYNGMEPIIPESEIEKLNSKEEIEKAHQSNRRTEFKILRTDYVQGSINLSDLYAVKAAMSGQWLRINDKDTIVENYKFLENSFEGEHKSAMYISTAPLFTLLREDNKTIIRWLDLTGGGFDYLILALTANKMIVQYLEQKIEYIKR